MKGCKTLCWFSYIYVIKLSSVNEHKNGEGANRNLGMHNQSNKIQGRPT